MPSMTPATRRALEFRSEPLRDRERRLRPAGIHRFGVFVQRCFHSFAAHQVGPGLAQTDDLGQHELDAASGGLIVEQGTELGAGQPLRKPRQVLDRLGVDDIGIGAGAGESSDNAAFKMGKYLSPKL